MDSSTIPTEIDLLANVNEQNANSATCNNNVALKVHNLNASYGEHHILKDLSIDIHRHKITAIIGPSGCGKSTFIRTLNRMNETIPDFHFTGDIQLNGKAIYNKSIDPVEVRLRVGMVFQRPNPFPKSIYKNITFGPKLVGIRKRAILDELVETSLKRAALWDEVKDKLNQSALKLSGGQQQRLCIARALAMQPEVLLLDEPCSALDPIATRRIEELLLEIKTDATIVIVTHNMQQASRVSDYCAMMWLGEMIEYGPTKDIFTNPKDQRTEDYVSGRLG